MTYDGDPVRRSTLQRRSFTGASPNQRRKVAGLVSIVSGQSPCDPAHLVPRSRGGCNHPDCVVPLTRAEHRAFDDGRLDLLPHLISASAWAELGHMTTAHHYDPISVLNRLTGDRYEPARQAA